jgi:integrase
LGAYGSPLSKQRYQEVIKRLAFTDNRAHSRTLPALCQHITIAVLIDRYTDFAQVYYGDSGEFQEVVYALQPLLDLFGSLSADDFTPQHLTEVQQSLIPAGLARSTINNRIGKIRRAFRWACSNGLVRPALWSELACVTGLKKGRTEAREPDKVRPVPLEVVFATLPWLTPVTATMVQVHLLCGMRSQDVCQMRKCDIDRTGNVWLYEPEKHKTAWRDARRVIAIIPSAQNLLDSYLKRGDEAYLFSPREAMRAKNVALRKESHRKSKVYPGELEASKNRGDRAKTTRTLREQYDSDSYRKAIRHAILKAKKKGVEIPHWHPHQLRHAAVTAIAAQFGQEAAQRYVGHTRLDTTSIYNELQTDKLLEIAGRVDAWFCSPNGQTSATASRPAALQVFTGRAAISESNLANKIDFIHS